MPEVANIKYRVEWAGVNITADITEYIESLTYTDAIEGESDDVQFVFNDTKGLFRDEWYPTKKDKVKVWIIEADIETFCGTFTIDEIELSGPPDLVTVKALAAASNSPIRTKKNRQLENVTLRKIAQTVADDNGLTLVDGNEVKININLDKERAALISDAATIRSAVAQNSAAIYAQKAIPTYNSLKQTAENIILKGFPEYGNDIIASIKIAAGLYFGGSLPDYQTSKAIVLQFASKLEKMAANLQNRTYTRTKSDLDSIQIEAITQYETTDIAFLVKLGFDYGILFNVRDTDLVFTSLFDLDAADGITTISRTQLKTYNIKDTMVGTFKKVKVAYHKPESNELITSETDAGSDPDSPELGEFGANEDLLQLRHRVENDQQAEKLGKVALHRANSGGRTGSATLPGNPLLVAGINFILINMGKMGGKYQVTKSSHTLTKGGGYEVSIEFKGVDKLPPGTSGGGTGSAGTGGTTDSQLVGGKALNDNISSARENAKKKIHL